MAAASQPGVYLEDLCFGAQQAAEKALKAVLIARGIDFPYVHDLARLMTLLDENGQLIPVAIREAAGLTRFAVATRYPGIGEAVTPAEYTRALELATMVVDWAGSLVEEQEDDHGT